MSSPKLMLSGQQAMAAVAKVLPTASPITVQSALGPVELKPGAVWSGDRMLFYCAPLYVYYAIGDKTYEWSTGEFVRDEWLNALSKGAKSAAHWEGVAKVEYALLTGLFVPWYFLLGVSCAKVTALYIENKPLVREAMQGGRKALELLSDLRRRSPTLFNKMMLSAAKQFIFNLPSGVTAEDVAFFIGRIVKGIRDETGRLALKTLIKIVAVVAALVTATHAPFMVMHSIEKKVAMKGPDLKKSLAEAGITLTDHEARTILQDLLRSPDTRQKLEELERTCKEFAPLLEKLQGELAAWK